MQCGFLNRSQIPQGQSVAVSSTVTLGLKCPHSTSVWVDAGLKYDGEKEVEDGEQVAIKVGRVAAGRIKTILVAVDLNV